MNRFFGSPVTIFLLLFMAFQSWKNSPYSSLMDWLMDNLIMLPGIIIGLSFHEFAHAWVATRCGDDTPRLQGRVTINPAAHIDPIGFLALLFIQFGWGRPVMVNPLRFRKPRRDEILVAIAGVTMNLLLAIGFLGSLRLLYQFWPAFMMDTMGGILTDVLVQVVFINLVLMVFNLLPVPPLDGFNILTQVFRLQNTRFHAMVYDKGFLILMALIAFNVTGAILSPTVNGLFNLLFELFFPS